MNVRKTKTFSKLLACVCVLALTVPRRMRNAGETPPPRSRTPNSLLPCNRRLNEKRRQAAERAARAPQRYAAELTGAAESSPSRSMRRPFCRRATSDSAVQAAEFRGTGDKSFLDALRGYTDAFIQRRDDKGRDKAAMPHTKKN
jgi:hypothetical protein